MFTKKSLSYTARSPWRNLFLLFMTIVMGLGSIMVMANLTIQTNLQNARQTIMRVTITDDGTDGGTRLMDINNASGKLFISQSLLHAQTSFSWNVLGLDANGELIYVPATGLAGGNGGDDGDWTIDGTNTNIYRTTGRVVVWAAPGAMDSDKFRVVGNNVTELTAQETTIGRPANIHLTNTVNTRMLWWYSDRFYVGLNNIAFFNVSSWGNVGIGTINPDQKFVIEENDQKISSLIISWVWAGWTLQANKNIYSGLIVAQGNLGVAAIYNQDNTLELGAGLYASLYITTGNKVGIGLGNNAPKTTLQVSGNFIAGAYNNDAIGILNAIVWWTNHNANGMAVAIIWWYQSTVTWTYNIIAWWSSNSINWTTRNAGIFWWASNIIKDLSSQSFIGWWMENIITGYYSATIGWQTNTIQWNHNLIAWGLTNTINNASKQSAIIGGTNNIISGSDNSIAMGTKNTISDKENVFSRNSASTTFTPGNSSAFLINAPFQDIGIGGVGINTANPLADLDVNGRIKTLEIDVTNDIETKLLKISSQSTGETCNISNKWIILLSWDNFLGCNGTARKQLDN